MSIDLFRVGVLTNTVGVFIFLSCYAIGCKRQNVAVHRPQAVIHVRALKNGTRDCVALTIFQACNCHMHSPIRVIQTSYQYFNLT